MAIRYPAAEDDAFSADTRLVVIQYATGILIIAVCIGLLLKKLRLARWVNPLLLAWVLITDFPGCPVVSDRFAVTHLLYCACMSFFVSMMHERAIGALLTFNAYQVTGVVYAHLFFQLRPHWLVLLIYLALANLLCVLAIANTLGQCKALILASMRVSSVREEYEGVLSSFPCGIMIARLKTRAECKREVNEMVRTGATLETAYQAVCPLQPVFINSELEMVLSCKDARAEEASPAGQRYRQQHEEMIHIQKRTDELKA